MNRVCGIIIVGDEFIVGIFDFKEASAAPLPLAVEQDALALGERVLKISLVPPVCAYLARLVRAGKFKDSQPPALDRVSPRHSHLDFDGRIHVVLKVADAS